MDGLLDYISPEIREEVFSKDGISHQYKIDTVAYRQIGDPRNAAVHRDIFLLKNPDLGLPGAACVIRAKNNSGLSVVLKMTNIDTPPFIDKNDHQLINAAERLLLAQNEQDATEIINCIEEVCGEKISLPLIDKFTTEINGVTYLVNVYPEAMCLDSVEIENLSQYLHIINKLYTLIHSLHNAQSIQIHIRDLKPSNLFIFDGDVVIGDLEYAGNFEHVCALISSGANIAGTPLYMPLDILINDPNINKDLLIHMDLYALVVTAFELMLSKDINRSEVMFKAICEQSLFNRNKDGLDMQYLVSLPVDHFAPFCMDINKMELLLGYIADLLKPPLIPNSRLRANETMYITHKKVNDFIQFLFGIF